jgi:hypothetical protein
MSRAHSSRHFLDFSGSDHGAMKNMDENEKMMVIKQ